MSTAGHQNKPLRQIEGALNTISNKMLTDSKLSRMEKAILKTLYEQEYDPAHDLPTYSFLRYARRCGGHAINPSNLCRWSEISALSLRVAKQFNNGHNDRIFDCDKAVMGEIEAGRAKVDPEKRKLIMENALRLSILMPSFHKRKSLLTNKHSASFSRSLRRLARRELIKRFGGFEVRGNAWIWIDELTCIPGQRARYIVLTEDGSKIAANLGGEMLTIFKFGGDNYESQLIARERGQLHLRPHPRSEDEEIEAKGSIGRAPGRVGR